MALHQNLLVDIPDDHGIHTKSAGTKGEKYVYKREIFPQYKWQAPEQGKLKRL